MSPAARSRLARRADRQTRGRGRGVAGNGRRLPCPRRLAIHPARSVCRASPAGRALVITVAKGADRHTRLPRVLLPHAEQWWAKIARTTNRTVRERNHHNQQRGRRHRVADDGQESGDQRHRDHQRCRSYIESWMDCRNRVPYCNVPQPGEDDSHLDRSPTEKRRGLFSRLLDGLSGARDNLPFV